MKFTRYLTALAWLASTATCFATPLPDIEHWAQASADTLAIADLETEIARQRLELVGHESGPKWFVGATLGAYQEPLSDTATRNYSRLNTTAGLRIPVLGSVDAARLRGEDADKILQISQLQRAYKLEQLLRDVRLAYSAYVRNSDKAATARAWLGLEEGARQVFEARTRAHELLEADRMGLQSGFSVARRDLDRYTLAMDSALAILRRLSKQTLDGIVPEPADWSTQCLARGALLEQLEKQPLVAIKQVELQAHTHHASRSRWDGIEAGVTLQQSLAQDLGGQGGQGTVLGFDMTVPFDLGGAVRARSSEGQLLLQQARLELASTLDEARDGLDGVLGRLRTSQTDMERSSQRLDTSLESNRMASLRARSLAGDVLEKSLMARYELYLSAIDYLDTVQRTEAAQIDALAYGLACEPGGPGLDSKFSVRTVLAQPLAQALAVDAARDLGPNNAMLAWFVWQGEALLQEPGPILPAGSGRLLVSFTDGQLATLQTDTPAATQLHRSLAGLHRQGWQVDLLFGDASYVLRPGREKLVQQVQAMAGFAFDGINLDLERSDLPAAVQAQWLPLTLSTVRAVHAASAWPLTLTTHFRELDAQPLAAELQQAGVNTVMAMVYVQDPAATTVIARRILSKQAGLPIVLVQSVEAQLPAASSGFASGRQASLLRWQAIIQRLAAMPNFAGVAVQSLENFNAMAP